MNLLFPRSLDNKIDRIWLFFEFVYYSWKRGDQTKVFFWFDSDSPR